MPDAPKTARMSALPACAQPRSRIGDFANRRSREAVLAIYSPIGEAAKAYFARRASGFGAKKPKPPQKKEKYRLDADAPRSIPDARNRLFFDNNGQTG